MSDRFHGKKGAHLFFSIDKKIERHQREDEEEEKVAKMWRQVDNERERQILEREEREKEKEKKRELERQRYPPQNVPKTREFFNIPAKEARLAEERQIAKEREEDRVSNPWRVGYQTFRIGQNITPREVEDFATSEAERIIFRQEQEERQRGIEVMRVEMEKMEEEAKKRAREREEEEEEDQSQSLLSLARKLARR